MRNRERGSITPIVAFGAVIICVMGIGGATIGRIVHARREAQNVGDSAALGVADSIRENGKGANRTGALTLAQRNSREPTTVTIEAVNEQWTGALGELYVTGRGGEAVDTPRFIFDGNAQVQGRGRARIEQERRTTNSANPADVVLVLDYSGSMMGTPIQTLEDAISGHLRDQRILLAYAAALFSDHLVGDVPFEPDSIQKILEMFQNSDAGGGTSPQIGFDKAVEFFQQRTGGAPRFVVFVSDGEPNDPAAATAGSQHMWDTVKPTVMTIHIGAPQASPFMISVSGPADDRGNKDFYFPVNDMEQFRRALAQILSKIACPFDKLAKQRIKDVSTVRAFLQDHNGNEIALPLVDDLADDNHQLGFFFDPQSFDIAVTIEACAKMRDEHQTLIVRYNRAVLVE